LGYALKILSLAEEARQALHPATPGGNLRMGAMDATAASRLPPLLPRFRALCPEVTLTLKTQPTRQLTQQVLDAALDCALVSLPQGTPPPDDLEYVSIFKEQLLLVLPASPQRFRFAAFAEGCTYRAMGKRFWRNQRRWRARSRTSAPITRCSPASPPAAMPVSCRRACSIP
jgi:DNA-binding transcriptional LysR family regulator